MRRHTHPGYPKTEAANYDHSVQEKGSSFSTSNISKKIVIGRVFLCFQFVDLKAFNILCLPKWDNL
jgi:hypothetical protein